MNGFSALLKKEGRERRREESSRGNKDRRRELEDLGGENNKGEKKMGDTKEMRMKEEERKIRVKDEIT